MERYNFEIAVHSGKEGLWFAVQDGTAGFVQHHERKTVETIQRTSSCWGGPRTVRYRGKSYPVRGGIRTPLFISLD